MAVSGWVEVNGAEPNVRFRESVDFSAPEQRLQLIRDVVAIANAGGGLVVVGARADGTDVGIGPERALQLAPGEVRAAVDGYITPDELVLVTTNRSLESGRVVVEIEVPPANEPPLVLARSGEFEAADGQTRTVFAAHSVYVRRSGRVQLARRDDYRAWRAEAERRTRDQVLERLRLVVDAPADSVVRVVDGDEIHEEPTYFLSRAAAMFEQRPERLLDGNDLRYLWLHRSGLDLAGPSAELVIQSAFRKRATLFLWLSRLGLHERTLKRYLWRVLDMKDRDKSDAARSILQVCTLFLSETDYDELRSALATSDYAHMREAAEEWSDRSTVEAVLADGADPELRRLTDQELLAEADRLLVNSGPGVPRRLHPVGLELLQRTRQRRQGGPIDGSASDGHSPAGAIPGVAPEPTRG